MEICPKNIKDEGAWSVVVQELKKGGSPKMGLQPGKAGRVSTSDHSLEIYLTALTRITALTKI